MMPTLIHLLMVRFLGGSSLRRLEAVPIIVIIVEIQL